MRRIIALMIAALPAVLALVPHIAGADTQFPFPRPANYPHRTWDSGWAGIRFWQGACGGVHYGQNPVRHGLVDADSLDLPVTYQGYVIDHTQNGKTFSCIDFHKHRVTITNAQNITITDSLFDNGFDNEWNLSMDDRFIAEQSATVRYSEFVGDPNNDGGTDQGAFRGHGLRFDHNYVHQINNGGFPDGLDNVTNSLFEVAQNDGPTNTIYGAAASDPAHGNTWTMCGPNPHHDHVDGLQTSGGVDHDLIQHNRIEVGCPNDVDDGIALGQENGQFSSRDTVIKDNLINGGNFEINCGDRTTNYPTPAINLQLSNNLFGRKFSLNYGFRAISRDCRTGAGVHYHDSTADYNKTDDTDTLLTGVGGGSNPEATRRPANRRDVTDRFSVQSLFG